MGEKNYIESKGVVETYLARLKYAIENGATIRFQAKRITDKSRDVRYTNEYTMSTLFPDEIPEKVLARELCELTVDDYLRTVEDLRFPERGKLYEFGKVYNLTDEIYIKVRVVLMGESGIGEHTTFVMSFHFAEIPFSDEVFPYKSRGGI